MFIMSGDYIKILKEGNYHGLIGIVKSYDGQIYYRIVLKESREEILCKENEIEKIELRPTEENKKVAIEILKNKIRAFDTAENKEKIDNKAKKLLNEFRKKFPYKENPGLINLLTKNDIISTSSDGERHLGSFSSFIENKLKVAGALNIYTNVYENIGENLNNFKEMLRIFVNDNISLADKIDAVAESEEEASMIDERYYISGMGQDRQLAKKIIFCFNEDLVLPILSTDHLKHFYNLILGEEIILPHFESLGEEYQFYTNQLIEFKEKIEETRYWNNVMFMNFLYDAFPPPSWKQMKKSTQNQN